MKNETKTYKNENFPVASLILGAKQSKPILEFYHFARTADDIADNPELNNAEKHKQLDRLDDQATSRYQINLLKAFHQDVDKSRYETWDDLILYCEFSANPVGRFLLSLYNVTSLDAFESSDALCTSLQILNHLQDCQKDFRTMDRIYLPHELLEDGQTYESLLSEKQTSPALRHILDICLDRTEELLLSAQELPKFVKSSRLRFQVKTTLLCAYALLKKLRKNDPILVRVELTKFDKFIIALKGFFS